MKSDNAKPISTHDRAQLSVTGIKIKIDEKRIDLPHAIKREVLVFFKRFLQTTFASDGKLRANVLGLKVFYVEAFK